MNLSSLKLAMVPSVTAPAVFPAISPYASSCRAFALCVLLSTGAVAQAATVQYNTRGALAGTDSLSWSQLGADGLAIAGAPATSVTTAGAAAASVSNASGDLTRADEGGPNTGFVGDFATGAALLGTFGNAGPLVITFANPVARVGAQMMSNEFGAFNGWLSAFDASSNLLGTVSFSGMAGSGQLDTAGFLGIGSTALNIASVAFSVTGTNDNDLWINTVSLSNQVVVTAVPEPSSYLLAAMGIMALGASSAWRRRGQVRARSALQA
jgi:PEP-CTERM motif